MDASLRMPAARAALVAAIALGCACGAGATRVGDAPPPAPSTVQSSAQQPAHVQADESASLRQGTITALANGGARVQIQGVWVDAGQTRLLRHGRPAGLDSLRVGEAIRFTVAPGSTATPALRTIYAP